MPETLPMDHLCRETHLSQSRQSLEIRKNHSSLTHAHLWASQQDRPISGISPSAQQRANCAAAAAAAAAALPDPLHVTLPTLIMGPEHRQL
jgi:hypothetical protein